MNQYKILFYDENYCIVALNTVYNIGEVMKAFIKTEINNSNYNGTIIFDSLLSSLSHEDVNRFYCFKSKNGIIDFKKRLCNYKVSNKFIKKLDIYFENNEKLINNSFLIDIF